jgi:hypothetical protein
MLALLFNPEDGDRMFSDIPGAGTVHVYCNEGLRLPRIKVIYVKFR